MSLLSLKTELRQELKLTPQLLQSMEVLQMNSQELLDYLGRLSEENPTLELSDSADLRSAYESLRQRASWLDAGTFGSSFAHEEDGPPEPGAVDRALESLSAFLCDQLERKRLPKPMLALCKYMAELVDEDGYLAQEDLDGLTELKIPADMVEQALDTLQSLEPAGVGARDLSQCLALQLQRQGETGPALEIVLHHLERLGRKQYHAIAQELGLIGACVIMLLFAALVLRGYWIALHTRDRFGALLVVGIITLIAMQVFLNIAVVTGMLPTTGIPLPFFSYGGTALCIQLAEMGIVLSVSRQMKPTKAG